MTVRNPDVKSRLGHPRIAAIFVTPLFASVIAAVIAP
jgi:hypothetical protein